MRNNEHVSDSIKEKLFFHSLRLNQSEGPEKSGPELKKKYF